MRNYRLFLKDILEAMSAIEDFIRDMTFDEFIRDDKTVSAVLRKLEIIDEAVKYLPEEIKQKKMDIPWKSMAGMRDRIIHGYFGVDYHLVWNAITKDLPVVKNKLHELLKEP